MRTTSAILLVGLPVVARACCVGVDSTDSTASNTGALQLAQRAARRHAATVSPCGAPALVARVSA